MNTRNPIEVSRNFVVENGLGILDIQGQADFSGALVFHGNLVTTVWNQFSGSIIQWFVNSPDNRFRSIGNHFHSISEVHVNADNLENTVQPIVNLFADGLYEVSIREFELDSEFWVANVEVISGTYFWECYPNSDFIVKTLPESNVDSGRVNKWRKKIQAGERPAIILAKSPNEDGFNCYFLIDGHHRINAYLEEKICPRAIIIEKVNPSQISTFALEKLDILGSLESAEMYASQISNRLKINTQQLHDKTIESINFDWKKGILEIKLTSQTIKLFGVSSYKVERKLPWGFSKSINEVNLSEDLETQVLELEIQSGDKIVVTFEASNLIS